MNELHSVWHNFKPKRNGMGMYMEFLSTDKLG